MDMDLDNIYRSMGTEEEEEVIEIEDELEEDELEELYEMTSPRISSWVGADGKQHHEIVVNNDDLNDSKNKLHMDPCPICYLPFATNGNHRTCCLPCGHLFGLSCIKKWLLRTSSARGKCPQCNTLCSYKDVIRLYTSCDSASAHQKTSATRHFPFTKQGFTEFKEHERLRRLDTKKMYEADCKRLVDVMKHQCDVAKERIPFGIELDDLSERAEELEHDDALRQHAHALQQRYDALGQLYDTLGRRADVLEQRANELERRLSVYKPTLKFFSQMYKEHLAKQKKKTKTCAATPISHKR